MYKYSDDQPRDDAGRFEGGDGTASTLDSMPRVEGHPMLIDNTKIFAGYVEDGPANIQERGVSGTKESVAITRLVATQPVAGVKRVQELVEHPEHTDRETISVAKERGKLYLLDGHHRALAALVRGRSHITATVYIPKDAKYSDDQPRDDHGRWGEGTGAGTARAGRALRTYKPSTANKQRWADKNEEQVSKYVGGQRTDDNSPADVTVQVGRTMHGIEVKTMLDNSNDKVTMHPASLARKEAWAKANNAVLHTVILDDRNKFGSSGHSGNRIYYRRGVGSFRLQGMTPVSGPAQLRQLMGMRKMEYDIVLPNGTSIWIGEE